MNRPLQVLIMLSTCPVISGCGSVTPWAQRGLKVDLARSNAAKPEIARVARGFLASHGFTYAGPAGYEAINKTNTVIDFHGPNAITASIQLDRKGFVYIYLNQERPMFSPDAEKVVDGLEGALKARWHDAVTKIPDQ